MKRTVIILFLSFCTFLNVKAQHQQDLKLQRDIESIELRESISKAVYAERAEVRLSRKDSTTSNTFCIVIKVKRNRHKKVNSSTIERISIEPDTGLIASGFFSNNLNSLRKFDYAPLMNGKNEVTFIIPFSEFPIKINKIVGHVFISNKVSKLFYLPRNARETIIYLNPVITSAYVSHN